LGLGIRPGLDYDQRKLSTEDGVPYMKVKALAAGVAAVLACVLAGSVAGAGLKQKPPAGLEPYGQWTYVQAMSIPKGGGELLVSDAHGKLWLYMSGVFSDERGIADFFPSHNGGKFQFAAKKINFSAYAKGKRAPKSDSVYTYVFDKKTLSLSLVSAPLEDGSKLAFLLYYTGTENLPRCGGKTPSISLKC
jgi:hypothetical protein